MPQQMSLQQQRARLQDSSRIILAHAWEATKGAAPDRMAGIEGLVGHAAGCPALVAPWAASLLHMPPPARPHAPM